MNIIFAGTSDFVPYATVTAMSILDNTTDKDVHFYYLWADIVKPIDDTVRENMFDMARRWLGARGAKIEYIDITDKVPLLDGQNIGMWGRDVSYTHYFYLFAPDVLPGNVNKAIYLDTDMIVNCDLKNVFENKLNAYLAAAAPSGCEAQPNTFNSGFLVLNLKKWRKDSLLNKLLSFGRELPRCDLCDQNLLNNYFSHSDIYFYDKNYNVFPQCFPELSVQDINIVHYASIEFGMAFTKPWKDLYKRFADLWWKYARQTPFYEHFIINRAARAATDAITAAHDVTNTEIQSIKQIIKPLTHHSFWWHLRHLKF